MKLNTKLFLLDLDGTIYLDNDLFPESLPFIHTLQEKNINYIFLTNNSSKSQNEYYQKLQKLNIPCTKENIFTSGMAMGLYLNRNYPNKKVYLVGTNALKNELLGYNIELVENNPDIVVIGFDRELTYSKLEKACEFIDNGAIYLATNPDYVCPIANSRYIPDCGSICDMIYNATKRRPFNIGKPSPEMINILAYKYHLKNNEIAMVGDRIYTDIAAGYNAKAFTILVLSGESTLETVKESSIKPDLILNTVGDIISLI